MRLAGVLKAAPTLFRIGFAEAVAYRAELLIWVLATTMPLVMLALWVAVARDAPVGRFGEREFTTYFLANFIVRQLTTSWAAWEINHEVRTGVLSMRLLRPLHPTVTYAVENLASVPLRLIISLPVAAVALALVGGQWLPQGVAAWGLWLASMLGGWLITFLANLVIGALCFFMQSSLKIMEVWFTGFLVLSGYLFPLELVPSGVRTVLDWLPFRYQLGLPVELMTSAHTLERGAALVGAQWLWVGVLLLATVATWRGGLRRYAAFGG